MSRKEVTLEDRLAASLVAMSPKVQGVAARLFELVSQIADVHGVTKREAVEMIVALSVGALNGMGMEKQEIVDMVTTALAYEATPMAKGGEA